MIVDFLIEHDDAGRAGSQRTVDERLGVCHREPVEPGHEVRVGVEPRERACGRKIAVAHEDRIIEMTDCRQRQPEQLAVEQRQL